MRLTSSDRKISLPSIPSASSKRRSRLLLAVWLLLLMPMLLLLVSGVYLFLRPRVQALSLPRLPAHLTESDLGLANWHEYQQPLPPQPLSDPHLPATPQVDSSLALLEDAAGQALLTTGQVERGLAYLQAAAQSDPENLRYNNDYRVALRDHQRYTTEYTYFSQLAQHTHSPNVLIGLALTYVDQMRSCPTPPDGLVCQAQESSRSISILDTVLAAHPYNVVARFARGLNHLYWPNLMGHLPLAQVDLQYAVALSKLPSAMSSAFAPQAYMALGDVFAKDGQVEKARNVWLNGKAVVSDSSMLDSRLAIATNQLVNEENGPLRGLGVFVDTSLAIFWKTGR
ncbi:MAG TPA: hypothetical protein VFB60_20225 [Ktedonobacteraceae bacterium]|nr:hypothetical protein [Ktedonobacteraceae bacterium]